MRAWLTDTGERQAKVKALQQSVARAAKMHHSMKVELQDVDERDQKVYEKKVRSLSLVLRAEWRLRNQRLLYVRRARLMTTRAKSCG